MTDYQDNGWLDRMTEQTPAAEKIIAAGDTFAPHDGTTSDLNQFAADLLADPDPGYDPTRRR